MPGSYMNKPDEFG